KNREAVGNGPQVISAAGSAVTVMVIPTDEEYMIAHDVERLTKNNYRARLHVNERPPEQQLGRLFSGGRTAETPSHFERGFWDTLSVWGRLRKMRPTTKQNSVPQFPKQPPSGSYIPQSAFKPGHAFRQNGRRGPISLSNPK
ncbi:MAG: hypothetical protein MR735_04575, partial [Collinsella sp.]|nr:hypothetical protein [Collinsella sp.]